MPAPSVEAYQNYIRAQQLESLRLEVAKLQSSNRRMLAPGLVLGLGITSMVVGGVVFSTAWNDSYDDCSGYYCDDDGYDVARDRAGLVMMPLGGALVLASVPLFIVRLSRVLRLRRAEGALRRLSVVQPTFSSSGPVGLSSRWTF